MELVWYDISHGFRALTKNRRFTVAALLSLAAGIGLNTAVFSFTDAVLLRPFPFRSADQLVLIWGAKSLDARRGMNGEDVENWRNQGRVFDDIAVFQLNPVSLSLDSDSTDVLQGSMIGLNAFSVLGVAPLIGHTFSDLQGDTSGDKTVVLSYGLWQSHFGGDVSIVGKSLRLNGEMYRVLGVMPPDFFFPDQYIQLWVPLTRASPIFGQVHALARLREGATIHDAQVELDTLSVRTQQPAASDSNQIQPGVFSLYRVVVGKYQSALWSLLAAVALLLLLACANVSNLLLARDVAREREFAVRTSCGATALRIFRLLLIENVMISLAAGALGVAGASVLLAFLRSQRLYQIPRFGSAHIDLHVLLFAFCVSLAALVVSGILPAWKSAHPDLNASLQLGGTSTQSRRHGQTQDLLVTVEVALAIVLMVAAGLLIKSFVRLAHAEWGFNPDHVLLVEARFPQEVQAVRSRRIEVLEEVTDRLSTLSFVRSSAVAYGIPIRYYWQQTHLAIDGRFVTSDWVAGTWVVGPGYFKTMGIPIVSGREFNQRDDQLSLRVAVVSKDLAQKLWPNKTPIGEQLQILRLKAELQDRLRKSANPLLDSETWRSPNSWEPDGAPWEVVGEAGNVRMFGLDSDTGTFAPFYLNYQQAEGPAPPVYRFLLRTSIEPLQAVPTVKDQLLTVEPGSKIPFVAAMTELIGQSVGGRGSSRLLLIISILFGGLSLLLATMGIYGVVSFTTALRTREIGIRRVLGARSIDISRMLIRRRHETSLWRTGSRTCCCVRADSFHQATSVRRASDRSADLPSDVRPTCRCRPGRLRRARCSRAHRRSAGDHTL